MASNIFPIADAEIAVNNDGTVTTFIPESERIITNRLGYKVNIKDEKGRWLDKISMVDDNGETIHTRKLAEVVSTQNEHLNAIIDSFIARSFSWYLPRTLNLHLREPLKTHPNLR